MTSAKPSAAPAPPLGGHWRGFGGALLPLALAGLLPLWAVLLLCVVFGLGARFAAWAEARFLALLLVLGLSLVGPLLSTLAHSRAAGEALTGQSILALLFGYIVIAAAGLLVYFGSEQVLDGKRRGLLLVLLGGLLAPTPLLVPALVGGALARAGVDDRTPRQRPPAEGEQRATRGAWLWVGAAVLGLTLLGFALPQPRPHLPAPSPTTVTAPAQPPHESAAQAAASAPRPSSGSATTFEWQGHLPPPPLDLMLGAFLLLFLLLVITLLRQKGGGFERKKFTLMDWLLPVALLLNLFILLILGVAGRRTGAGQVPPALPEGGGGQTGSQGLEKLAPVLGLPMDILAALLWFVFGLTALALLLAAYFLLRSSPTEAAALGIPVQDPEGAAVASAPALHRIRLAYRAAEAALREAGRGRSPAETPTGYAARLGHQHPALAPALTTLTRLYAPVRYGGKVDEADADAAEAASREVCGLAAQLPPIIQTEERADD